MKRKVKNPAILFLRGKTGPEKSGEFSKWNYSHFQRNHIKIEAFEHNCFMKIYIFFNSYFSESVIVEKRIVKNIFKVSFTV